MLVSVEEKIIFDHVNFISRGGLLDEVCYLRLRLDENWLVYQHQLGQQHLQQGCQHQFSPPWTALVSSKYWSFNPHNFGQEGNHVREEVTTHTNNVVL